MKPHKHAEIIKAWAENTTIPIQMNMSGHWQDCHDNPSFNPEIEYRIKPAEPEKVYPVTNIEANKLHEICWGGEKAGGLISVANAAIRRAIDDGQVVIAEELALERSQHDTTAAMLRHAYRMLEDTGWTRDGSNWTFKRKPGTERELAVAKAIRSEAIRRSMYGDHRIKQAICDIDCRAIIAGVK